MQPRRRGQILGRNQRTVIVAVVAVRVVKVAGNPIVDVVAMRHRLVPAAGAVYVSCLMRTTAVVRGAVFGVLARYLDHVFVDMIFMRVVEVAIMQIVGIAAMADGGMSAARSMPVLMVGVGWSGASRHGIVSFPCPSSADTPVRRSAAWSIALRTNGNTCSSARE